MSKEESKQEKIKKPASAYVLYTNKIRSEVKNANPKATSKELMKILGDMWKALPEDDRKNYQAEYAKKKQEYDSVKPSIKEEKKLPKPKPSKLPKPTVKKTTENK